MTQSDYVSLHGLLFAVYALTYWGKIHVFKHTRTKMTHGLGRQEKCVITDQKCPLCTFPDRIESTVDCRASKVGHRPNPHQSKVPVDCMDCMDLAARPPLQPEITTGVLSIARWCQEIMMPAQRKKPEPKLRGSRGRPAENKDSRRSTGVNQLD